MHHVHLFLKGSKMRRKRNSNGTEAWTDGIEGRTEKILKTALSCLDKGYGPHSWLPRTSDDSMLLLGGRKNMDPSTD